MTCNWRHAADPTANWTTIYLTMCWWVLRQKGVCEIGGQPFKAQDRHLARLSIGHWVHGKMMTTGWLTPHPKSFKDFRVALCNIKAESWAANSLKSDFSHDRIQEALTLLLGTAINFADVSSGGPSQQSSSFMPDEKEWLEMISRIANYGVGDSARALGEWSSSCNGCEIEV